MQTLKNLTLSPQNIDAVYNDLFDKIVNRRVHLNAFRSFLETKTSWLTSPASSRYHLNIEKGLLMHSVGVTLNALRIKHLLAPDISDESIVIVSLFHDVGKVGFPGKPNYLPNTNQDELRQGIRYRYNTDLIHMSHAVRSLHLISQFVPLSEEEVQAIVAHDGLYPLRGGVNNLDFHQRECRLQMILHFADKWTAAVIEEGRT